MFKELIKLCSKFGTTIEGNQIMDKKCGKELKI